MATEGQTVITVVSRSSDGTTPEIGVAAGGAVRVDIAGKKMMTEGEDQRVADWLKSGQMVGCGAAGR
jgi:hypothetical protein